MPLFFLLVLPKLYCTVRYPLAETGELVQNFSKSQNPWSAEYTVLRSMVYVAWSPLTPHFGRAVIVDGEAAPFGRSGSDHALGPAASCLKSSSVAPTYTVSEAAPCGLSHFTEMTCVSDKPRLLASLISGQMEAYIGMRIDTVLVW